MCEKAFNEVKQMRFCPTSLLVNWEEAVLCGDKNAERLHQQLPKGKARLVLVQDTANTHVEPPFYPATATRIFMVTIYNNVRFFGGIALILAGSGLNVCLVFIGEGMEDQLKLLGEITSSHIILVRERNMTPEMDAQLMAMCGLVKNSQPQLHQAPGLSSQLTPGEGRPRAGKSKPGPPKVGNDSPGAMKKTG